MIRNGICSLASNFLLLVPFCSYFVRLVGFFVTAILECYYEVQIQATFSQESSSFVGFAHAVDFCCRSVRIPGTCNEFGLPSSLKVDSTFFGLWVEVSHFAPSSSLSTLYLPIFISPRSVSVHDGPKSVGSYPLTLAYSDPRNPTIAPKVCLLEPRSYFSICTGLCGSRARKQESSDRLSHIPSCQRH